MRLIPIAALALGLAAPGCAYAAITCDSQCYGVAAEAFVASGSAQDSSVSYGGPTSTSAHVAIVDPTGSYEANASTDIASGSVHARSFNSGEAYAYWYDYVGFNLPEDLMTADVRRKVPSRRCLIRMKSPICPLRRATSASQAIRDQTMAITSILR